MRRRCYVLLRRRHDVSIRRCGDVPLRCLGDVPPRRRWVFHLRRTYDLLRRHHDVLFPVMYRTSVRYLTTLTHFKKKAHFSKNCKLYHFVISITKLRWLEIKKRVLLVTDCILWTSSYWVIFSKPVAANFFGRLWKVCNGVTLNSWKIFLKIIY